MTPVNPSSSSLGMKTDESMRDFSLRTIKEQSIQIENQQESDASSTRLRMKKRKSTLKRKKTKITNESKLTLPPLPTKESHKDFNKSLHNISDISGISFMQKSNHILTPKKLDETIKSEVYREFGVMTSRDAIVDVPKPHQPKVTPKFVQATEIEVVAEEALQPQVYMGKHHGLGAV